MKRQIIVRIIVCIAVVATLFAGVFMMAACGNKTGDDGASYQLNLSNFDGITTYGEPMDLSRITLTRTDMDGTTTEIPIDLSMVTSHVDTTKIGGKLLKFNYAGQSFHVPVVVMYKVQFEVDGEVFKTFHLLNIADMEEVVAPEKPGYVFEGWSTDIPDVLTDNMTFTARYTPEIPAISEVEATYGDSLKGIKLPYTVVGAWQFDDAEGTVGDAGKKIFPVSFVAYETGEVLATDTVTVNVEKKEITFSEIVDSFIYNGTRQLPTYKTDASVNVIFYEDAGANYTDAGTYNYYFEVDDPNYKGTLVGTYEIKPAQVTVKINSYTILSNEALPTVEYEVSGFDNLELIGLSITNPEDVAAGVGVYTLTATATNPNIVLEVEEGTLTINTTTLNIADPTLSTGTVTYGDLISTITFSGHPNGKWTWKSPEDFVGTVGKQTHIAVFTPTDSRYDVIERPVEITVAPKQMVIEIVGGTTFDYNSSIEHSVSYVVKDANGEVYDLVVLGNTPQKNAGVYEITLTLEDANYSATKVVTLTINKIDPVTNFDQVLTAIWSKTLTLSDVELPAGYSWTDLLTTEIPTAGTHRFAALYTPEDTVNYNTVAGEFEVEVAKATASINNVNEGYDFIYNGNAFVLDTVTRSHTESELVFVYQKDGQAVASLTNAGVYTVTITLPETGNYNEAVVTTTVTIAKATNVENVILSQTATYGDLVFEKIVLPAGVEGTWSIKDVDAATTVGDAGTKKLVAVYTSTTGNYNSREVEITVTVAQKRINAPTIPAANRDQIYTGATLTSGLLAAEGYTVTDNGGINVGTYTVTVALANGNYVWSDGTDADKTLTYRIVAADNQWTAAPSIDSWVYGEAGNAGTAQALAGTVTIEYKLASADDSAYSTTIPTNAGAYVARFTATDSNYKDLVTTCDFSIEKKAVTVPEITDSKLEQVYTGSNLTSGLVGTSEYNVTDNGGSGVGTYTVTLSLIDKNNYKWNTTNASENVQLTYQVVKAQIVITDLAIDGWTYGTKANAPTSKTNFTCTVTYVYATEIDGEYTATVPTAAGTYYVKAIAQGNENLIGAESAAISFGIAKASVNINGTKDDTKVYDTKEYTITGVTASNGATLTVVITKDGEVVEKIIDAGEYTVTFSLEESDNYLAAEKSVTVTVTPADNKDVVIGAQNATYGDLVSVLQLPVSTIGTWSIQDADATTTVGNAGTNKFVAIFTPATGNYNSREVEITVTVAQKRINAPTIPAANRDQIYTGATLTSGLLAAEGYTVTDNGGINVGTYTVTVALANGNYVWSDGTDADKTLTYRIVAADNQWTAAPSIDSWVYGEAGNAGTAQALAGTVTIEYKLASADDSAYSTTIPTNAGAYVARFTATDSNYKDLVTTCDFSIEKKAVTVPEITDSKLEQVYTGSNLTSGLVGTSEYNVTDNGGSGVGTYTVTLSLIDKNNYKWNTTNASENVQLTYQVVKAQIVITDLAIDGWTYGTKANAPTSKTNFTCTVTYVYATEIDGEYTATVPTAAGTYYVKAIAQGNENLIGAESAAISFGIAKASVNINGTKDDTKVYDTKEYTITGVTASNGATLTVVITKDGEVVEKIIDAGEYTVTFSLEESDNYLAAEKSVTVTVTPATNNEIVNTNQSAVYGDLVSVITLPAGIEGSWTIKNVDAATKVGNAGTNTFTAVFTSTTGNYNSREVVITVNVAKATVQVPIVDPKEYDGQHHNSGLTATNDYTVTTDIGGIDHGTYEVVITLIDPANYKWETADTESITLKYEISAAINKWAEEPTINSSWEYESTGDIGHATALHGGVKIEYKLESANDSAYSTTLPTLPGKYVARFTTTDENYTILSVTKAFEITKRKITPPTQTETEFVYTGNTITSGIVENDFFTVVDNGAIDVQAGLVVTVTLKSEHYVWSDGVETLAREYTYSITKAQIVISDLAIDGWTFGDSASTPTSNTNFTCNVSYVYASAIGGEYSATVPTDAGVYYVKAIAQGDENLIGAESAPVSFTIAKASVTIDGANDTYSKVYDTEEFIITGVTVSNGADVTVTVSKDKGGKAGIKMIDVGTYTVTFSYAGDDNYLPAEKSVTVTITPATNSEIVNTNQSATYGDSISVITLPTGVEGSWSIKDATDVGNAGTKTFVAVYTSTTGNYNSREVEITVTVARKTINAPTISASKLEQVYTGSLLTSGLANGTGYTVSDDGGINVGIYTATITLDATNYVWSDGTDAAKTLNYQITAAENHWAEQPTISGSWIYGQAGDAGSATPEFGDLTIEYKPAGADDSAYSTTLPTNAGSYVARFTATDSNHITLTDVRTFTIAKATVEVPTIGDKTYTGSTVTAGLASTNDYTVTDNGGINVGSYTATLTLKDAANHKWNTTGESADITLDYAIVQAQIVISDFAISGWTFGNNANVPTLNTNFACNVSYVYATEVDGEYSATVPTAAGTYYVKAIAAGDTNLIGTTSDAVEFKIAKAQASINGAQASYTTTYTGNDFVIEGISASYAGAPALEYAKVQNAGTYEIEITLPESDNYLGTSVTVTVTINPADNTTDVVDQAQEAVYGDSVSVIELPTSTIGTWSIKGDATTVGNAGKNTFIAVFTPATGNYNACEVEIVVDVARKTINVPTLSATKAEQTYTGATLTSGLTAAEGYTVVDNGGVIVGSYTATVTLDAANYVWSDGTDGVKTYTYKIIAAENDWSVVPEISGSWIYGQEGDAGRATAAFGGVKIEYKLATADDDAYSTTLPTNAGNYVARFTTTDTNYTKLVETRTFTIKKATVSAPTVEDKTYTGSTITSGLVDTDYYTVTTDEGGINVGTYNVTLTLKDSDNYTWGSDSATTTVSYQITKAQAVITGPTISGWTYGQNANAPTASTTFGTVTYVYAPVGGEYSATVPTTAGDYNVKAVVEGNANFNGAESAPVAFTIAKAAASIEGAQESYTITYNGNAYIISGVTASNGLELTYSYTKDGQVVSEMKNAGTYKVVITLAESENYLGDEVEVTVTINKIENTDTIPTYTATYGDLLSSLTPPESATGTWSWKDASAVVGNTGVQTHVLVFTPDDSNYATREANATVTVSKKTMATPTVPNASIVYNGQTQYSGLTDTALYTVTDNGGVNVGSYTVTLTLVDPANYAWNTADNANTTVTVSYEITPTDNEISATVNDVPYGAELDMTVTVKFGGWTVAFKNAAGELVDKPVAAGKYTAIFTTTDTNCEILTIERVFNINIAKVEPPSVSNKPYTGEKITSGLESNQLYTIVADEGGINVGEYTVTVRLTDPSSSEWFDGGSADKVLTYNITKLANTTLSDLVINNWTYGTTASTPTAKVNHAALTSMIVFTYSTDDGATWSTTVPANAGTYKIKAEIVGTDNYDGASIEGTFTINKATPTITTAPSFVGGSFYQNTFAPTGEGAVTSVAGSWSFANATLVGGTFSATADNAQVVATFTPNDTANYNNVTVTYSVTFVPVAYLNNETPYGTIEDAIADANTAGSGVVWVRPYSADLGPIQITSDVTIYAGVTLVLPYGTNGAGRNTFGSTGTIDVPAATESSSANPADDTKCFVMVLLADGKTITNNGTIEIAGQLSGGAGAARYSGFTAGEHAKLILGANAKIDNYGTIYAAGYIREQVKNNGSTVVINKGATLFQPFTVRDFPGGSVTYATYKTLDTSEPITAFSRFIMMNVSPLVRINYGGSLKTWALLYAGSQINQTVGDIIGSGTGNTTSVISLTDETYSYLTAKYDTDTEVCDLDIYGGAKTNPMKLTVKVLTSITVSTEKALFAISHHYDVGLHKSEGQETATFNMGQKFKIMTGAKFLVDEGVILNVNELIVYETFNDIRSDAGTTADHPMRYPVKDPGELIVNGELVINKFGGKIHSTGEGAKVTINTAVSYTGYEIKVTSGSSFSAKVDSKNPITEKASLVNEDGTKVILANATTGEYVNGVWVVPDSLKLHFNSNGGSAQDSVDIFSNDVYPALPTPTRDHYVFAGWKDSNGNLVTQGSAIKVDRDIANGITLTAQWTPVEYNLNYEWKFEGFDSDPTISWAESLGTFNIETAKITLPTPTNATGSFVGWYTDAACGNVILNGTISGAELVALYNGNATIYGLWTNQQYTIKFEGDTFDDVPYTNDTVVYTPTQLPTATLPAIPTTYETDVTIDKYFEGWYYNGTKVTDFSFITDSAQEYTLTAKWVDKVSITYTANNTGIYANLITNGSETLAYGTAYWYKSGTTITLANVTANDGVVTDTALINYCQSLTLNGAAFDKSKANTAYTLSANTTIHITWGTKTKVFVDSYSIAAGDTAIDGKFTLMASTTNSDTGKYYTSSQITNKDATYYVAPEHYIMFSVSAPSSTVPTTWTAVGTTEHSYQVDYQPKKPNVCVTPDTLVTLADGTQKRIDAVKPTDMLLVWNFYEGKYDVAPASILMNHGYDTVEVLTLVFADGTTIGTINGHGFFDEALNEFVILKADNVADFVGHSFVKLDGDSYSTTELVGYSVETRYTEVWSILTVRYYNCILEGLWSVTEAEVPNSPTYLMPFVVGEDMKYDSELMQADIEKYGLYTYEEFAMYCTKEQFEALGLEYFKVAVGKGYITREQIIFLLEVHCS